MSGSGTLPEGGRGQALALALTLGLAAALAAGALPPLIGWYDARAAEVARRAALERHLADLAAATPKLRRALALRRVPGAAPAILLPGNSDAIAGAALQSLVQTLAKAAGTSLASAEILPARPAGAWRRIGLRIAFTAPYPVLVGLMARLAEARPSLLIGGFALHANPVAFRRAARLNPGRPRAGPPAAAPLLSVRLTILAFRDPSQGHSAR